MAEIALASKCHLWLRTACSRAGARDGHSDRFPAASCAGLSETCGRKIGQQLKRNLGFVLLRGQANDRGPMPRWDAARSPAAHHREQLLKCAGHFSGAAELVDD